MTHCVSMQGNVNNDVKERLNKNVERKPKGYFRNVPYSLWA